MHNEATSSASRSNRPEALLRLALLLILVSSVVACTRMGPKLTVKDHVEYPSAIGESWKTEVLSNIVRLRYGDWPVFTKIETAISNYTLQHQVIAGAVVRSPWGGKNQGQLFYTGKVNEAPRAILTPLGGPMFVQSMLTPIPSSIVLSLLQSSGWSADRVLQTMLFAVNGKRNLHAVWDEGWSMTIAPELDAFVHGIHQAQLERALSIQRSTKRDGGALNICFRTGRLSPTGLEALRELREELDLDASTDCYRVQVGNRPPDRQTLVIQTRSVLALLVSLGAYVQVPPEDILSGVAPDIGAMSDEIPKFLRIKAGHEAPHPDLIHAAVKYRDYWFWIEHTDADSKRTMAYLGLLMNLAEAGPSGGAQLILNVGKQATPQEAIPDARIFDDLDEEDPEVDP